MLPERKRQRKNTALWERISAAPLPRGTRERGERGNGERYHPANAPTRPRQAHCRRAKSRATSAALSARRLGGGAKCGGCPACAGFRPFFILVWGCLSCCLLRLGVRCRLVLVLVRLVLPLPAVLGLVSLPGSGGLWWCLLTHPVFSACGLPSVRAGRFLRLPRWLRLLALLPSGVVLAGLLVRPLAVSVWCAAGLSACLFLFGLGFNRPFLFCKKRNPHRVTNPAGNLFAVISRRLQKFGTILLGTP